MCDVRSIQRVSGISWCILNMFELRLLSLTSHQQQIPIHVLFFFLIHIHTYIIACVIQNYQWKCHAHVNAS